MSQRYQLQVNAIGYTIDADHDRTLLDVIRDDIGLTGTKQGCDDCECGACMVLVDGRPVNSCSYLAIQAADRTVTTVEGVAGSTPHPLQQQFLEAGGVQCGFCTPGMLMSAIALLDRNPRPSREEIGIGLGGNLCRCTGYAGIIAAVEAAAQEMSGPDDDTTQLP